MKRAREEALQVQKKLQDSPIVHRNLADMKNVLNRLVPVSRKSKASGATTRRRSKWK